MIKERKHDRMIIKSKEKRDIWIGHKLGNVITDVKIGGKESLNEAVLIQHSLNDGSVPVLHTSAHNFRGSAQEQRQI